jgi:hypothetical protein
MGDSGDGGIERLQVVMVRCSVRASAPLRVAAERGALPARVFYVDNMPGARKIRGQPEYAPAGDAV